MKKLLFFIFPAVLFLSGCAATIPVDVNTDYDKAAPFAQYKTFKWYQEKPTARPDSAYKYDTFLDQRIKKAVEAQLNKKGFRLATGMADVLIAYDAKVVTRQEVNNNYAFAPGFGYGYSYWYGYRYNYGYSRFSQPPMLIDQYKDGSIIIDMIDAKDNQLIWRGWGQMEVLNQNISEAEVTKIVTSILAKYPPGSEKK